jgi:hypothetical protein
MKCAARIIAVGLLAGLLAIPASASAASKPLLVGKDAAGDWGSDWDYHPDPAAQPAFAAFGDGLGQDLVGASIGMKDKKTLNFIIDVTALPAPGGTPEGSRYSWDFLVGKTQYELDGKFTNYTRGVCDPTSGVCPPPRDPGQQPFFLRGKCSVQDLTATQLTVCEELAVIKATFDQAKSTITIPVPLALIKAKAGTLIKPAIGTFGASIDAAPAAFLTSGYMPMDHLSVTKTFKVPR